jgi:hypothetical protein
LKGMARVRRVRRGQSEGVKMAGEGMDGAAKDGWRSGARVGRGDYGMETRTPVQTAYKWRTYGVYAGVGMIRYDG